MAHPHNFSSTQSGNILIYILGAIFLLGLLVVLIKGSSTPGSNIDEEGLIIRVSEVQEYGMELESAVALIMANGFSEADIRFAHPDASSAYGDITDTPTRQVFSRQGGGATFRDPPSGIQTTVTPWIFNATNRVKQIGTTCAAAGCADLLAILPNVTEAFCLLLNEKNDIPDVAGAPPEVSGSVSITTEFVGTYSGTNLIDDAGDLLTQKSEGCFENSSAYHHYRVLMAR